MTYVTRPIAPRPGVYPDNLSVVESVGVIGGESEFVADFWVDSDKMRSVNGFPESIGTTIDITPYYMPVATNATPFLGRTRSIFAYNRLGTQWFIFGSTKGLWAVEDSFTTATNITPFNTSSTAIANSLATQYVTLANNPITTDISGGSPLSYVTVAMTGHGLRVGDSITVAGVTGNPGGITNANLNGVRTITLVVDANNFKFNAGGNASSSTSGGGASVIVSTGKITVTHNAHGFSNQYRVKLSGAADTGGILAASINKEFMIRNKTTNTYDIMTAGVATSAVSGGGGASTVEYAQITLTDSAATPIIWSLDKFNEDLVCCPGNGGGIYAWLGDITASPTLITNAPTQANWIFVHNGKLCALGAYSASASNQRDNRFMNSNTGDYTDWTIAAGSQAYEDVKEEATRFIAHAKQDNRILLFTDGAVHIMDDIGGDDVWQFGTLTKRAGCGAAKGILEVNGIVYFIGSENIYQINGNIVEPVPNNTVLQYWIGLLNIYSTDHRTLHITYNEQFQEIYIHIGNSSYIMCGLNGYHWFIGTMNRTVGYASPNELTNINITMATTIGVDSNNLIWLHEQNANTDTFDGVSHDAYITCNYASIGDAARMMTCKGLIINGLMESTVGVTITTRNIASPDIAATTVGTYTVDNNSPTFAVDTMFTARFRQIKFFLSGGASYMRISGWGERVKPAGAW